MSMHVPRPVRAAAFTVAVILAVAADSGQGSGLTRIVLVGDSTVTDDAGWGLAFRELLTEGVECINSSAGGRSSKSFIDEGRWAQALALKGNYYLIQFGHNDQPGKGPERETDPATTYPQYLSRYVDEARAIGAAPVLVTSLTRRHFDPNGKIVSTLTPYVDAVRRLAAAKRVPVIDLHASSLELAERMGEAAWIAISPRDANGEVDRTHLNEKSRALIAALVARELRTAVPELARFIRPVADPASAPRVQAVSGQDGPRMMTSTAARFSLERTSAR
jgi:pectinesterase